MKDVNSQTLKIRVPPTERKGVNAMKKVLVNLWFALIVGIFGGLPASKADVVWLGLQEYVDNLQRFAPEGGYPNLIIANEFTTYGYYRNIAVSGSTLYSGEGSSVYKWNAQTGEYIGPHNLVPVLSSHIEATLNSIGVAANGDLLFAPSGFFVEQRTVARYSSGGNWVCDYTCPRLMHPRGKPAASSDAVFVGSRYNLGAWTEMILMFAADGTYLREFGAEMGGSVGDVSVMGSNLYALDYNHGIHVYALDGTNAPAYSHLIPFPAGVNPYFGNMDGLLAHGGALYVADSPDHAWYKISLTGEMLATYTGEATEAHTYIGSMAVYSPEPLPFTYETDGSGRGITITDYTGAGGDVIIPDTIDDLPVTRIGSFAFAYCYDLTSVAIPSTVTMMDTEPFYDCLGLAYITVDDRNAVYSSLDGVLFNKNRSTLIKCPLSRAGNYTIPDSVNTIRMWAFWQCSSLTNVTISTNVVTIGNYAFEDCYSLSNMTIPNSVTNIEGDAFHNCFHLQSITVDDQNVIYSSLDGALFNHSRTTLIRCPGGRTGSYTVPNIVTAIGTRAFCNCTYLTSVIIPAGVISIGVNAFERCYSLSSLSISDSVTTIGSSAFWSCFNLTSITIPGSVTTIDAWTFENCSRLSYVYFAGNAPTTSVNPSFSAFINTTPTIYYQPCTTGWGAEFAGRPTLQWNPQVQAVAGFGVNGGGRFGFTILGTNSMAVAVEACTNLTGSVWVPVSTVTLSNGAAAFTDAASTNLPARFYRFRMP